MTEPSGGTRESVDSRARSADDPPEMKVGVVGAADGAGDAAQHTSQSLNAKLEVGRPAGACARIR